MRPLASLAPALLLVAACSATPPARWAEGGAELVVPRARWVRGDVVIDVMPDGRVLANGELAMRVDRAGRVFDEDGEPIALLEADGRVVGPDDAPLGNVGMRHAAIPDEPYAWLTVTDTGEVIRYDDEGERSAYGIWGGCAGPPQVAMTCTLVTHLVGMRLRAVERQGSGVSIGIGVGVGVPLR